ncbi:MAG: methyltransferase regulatory domain-containing protein, partial [Syntrophobacterales bacterium]|nr:methyltransferase regulatory domain-containing protein [Syntrophobacterales bacterium]
LKLIEANAAMSRARPAMKVRLEKFPTLDRAYLIQEYLHDNWRCLWFDELAAEVGPAKLVYLTTATASDWFLPALLPPAWKTLLAEHDDPIVREVMLDVLINQSFRRDVWVRGQIPLWPDRQRELLLQTRLALLAPPQPKDGDDNPYKYTTSLGEVTGKPEVYAPLYDALAAGPKTVAELLRLPLAQPPQEVAQTATIAQPPAARQLPDTLQALGLMLSAGHVALVRTPSDKLLKGSQALNRAILQAVWAGAPYRNVVAAAYPWVLHVSDGDLMLAYAKLAQPKADAGQLGKLWAEQLRALGRGLAKDGQPLTTPEALEARATELAEVFLAKTWPTWQRLGVF